MLLFLATNIGGNSFIATVPIEVKQLDAIWGALNDDLLMDPIWRVNNDDLLLNETEIELSDDYYIANNSSDYPENEIVIELSNGEYNYNAVSDLSENATEIEI